MFVTVNNRKVRQVVFDNDVSLKRIINRQRAEDRPTLTCTKTNHNY